MPSGDDHEGSRGVEQSNSAVESLRPAPEQNDSAEAVGNGVLPEGEPHDGQPTAGTEDALAAGNGIATDDEAAEPAADSNAEAQQPDGDATAALM